MNNLIVGLITLKSYTEGIKIPLDIGDGEVCVRISKPLSDADELNLRRLGWTGGPEKAWCSDKKEMVEAIYWQYC